MERILLRHIGGSRTSQVDEFPVKDLKEILIGRDPVANVKYDPDRDDLVSRRHARITLDAGQVVITDLNSRNGTYVNKQRITQPARLTPGDVVQLGAGGPEFQFDVFPPEDSSVKATRLEQVVGVGTGTMAATRVSGGTAEAPKAPIGKATVERMISQNVQRTRRTMFIGAGALIILVALAATLLIFYNDVWKRKLLGDIQAGAPMTPAEIVKANANSVVYIECGWKLIYTATGGQVYHRYVPNEYVAPGAQPVAGQGAPAPTPPGQEPAPQAPGEGGQEPAPGEQPAAPAQPPAQPPAPPREVKQPIIPDGRRLVAAYIAVSESEIEPALTLDSASGMPIGGEHSGSGFVVTTDGFILTNRHVASAWLTAYHFGEEAEPGVLLGPDGQIALRKDGKPVLVQPPYRWVPARAKQAGMQLQGGFEGRNDYLNVTFAKQQLRIPSQVARVSDRHDVAMIKIQVPEPVRKVELLDSYDTIRAGDAAIVLGYPAVSPMVLGVSKSQDAFNPEARIRVIPDPTVTVGNIGRVLRGQKPEGANERETAQYSEFGDAYQLTINATGGGNSGGPLLDDRGRVVAIFFASRSMDARISFAVPIRYAMELMSATSR